MGQVVDIADHGPYRTERREHRGEENWWNAWDEVLATEQLLQKLALGTMS